MSSVDDVLSRIQGITERIRQIQSLAHRPPGEAQSSGGSAASAASGPGSAGAAGAPADGAGTAAFQDVLLQSLSAGIGTTTDDELLSTDAVSSLLRGLTTGTGAAGTAESARLYEYQRQLIDAIRELSARTLPSDGGDSE